MFLLFFLFLHLFLLLLQPSANYRAEKAMSDKLNFPKHTGIREASLLLVKEKCGRYTLIREPLYLDRCVVCSEADWDDYFEVQEISSKDTFIFKVSSRRQAISNIATPPPFPPHTTHSSSAPAWARVPGPGSVRCVRFVCFVFATFSIRFVSFRFSWV